MHMHKVVRLRYFIDCSLLLCRIPCYSYYCITLWHARVWIQHITVICILYALHIAHTGLMILVANKSTKSVRRTMHLMHIIILCIISTTLQQYVCDLPLIVHNPKFSPLTSRQSPTTHVGIAAVGRHGGRRLFNQLREQAAVSLINSCPLQPPASGIGRIVSALMSWAGV